MKLKKGSAAAKAYMANIRAKRKKVKVSGAKESKAIKKTAKKLKVRLPHGYQTERGKVRINGISADLKRKYNAACEFIAVYKSNIVFNKSMALSNPEKKGYYNSLAKQEAAKLKEMIKIKNKLAKFKK